MKQTSEIEEKIEEILRNQFVDRAKPEAKEDHWGVRDNTEKLFVLFQEALSSQLKEVVENAQHEIKKRIIPHSMYAESPSQALNQDIRNQAFYEAIKIIDELAEVERLNTKGER